MEREQRIALLKEVQDALLRLYHPRPASRAFREDFCGRTLVCTPYEGCYGIAGWAVCVNGSPPRGTVFLALDSCTRVGDVLFYSGDRCRRLTRDSKAAVLLKRLFAEHLEGRRESVTFYPAEFLST